MAQKRPHCGLLLQDVDKMKLNIKYYKFHCIMIYTQIFQTAEYGFLTQFTKWQSHLSTLLGA
ncbi:Hypothetical protein ETEE_3880 [Edwardsiella anguillarum ET080813]|uniref:Uncharacterized protein n=1 Tax=Edwardsiella anguillarum ET080813 TaxID=667120 RepID=A0A076LNX0_9GAMM|nr:Hypothetical protein ETEE_3880 [Edwardsiella anguillarum ET080813]